MPGAMLGAMATPRGHVASGDLTGPRSKIRVTVRRSDCQEMEPRMNADERRLK
jgi:hypothetical protein